MMMNKTAQQRGLEVYADAVEKVAYVHNVDPVELDKFLTKTGHRKQASATDDYFLRKLRKDRGRLFGALSGGAAGVGAGASALGGAELGTLGGMIGGPIGAAFGAPLGALGGLTLGAGKDIAPKIVNKLKNLGGK